MSSNPALSHTTIDAHAAAFDSGEIRFYASDNTLLGVASLAATAFGTASGGSASLAGTPITVTPETGVNATASKAFIVSSDESQFKELSVSGTGGGGDIEMSSTTIEDGGTTVEVTGYSITDAAYSGSLTLPSSSGASVTDSIDFSGQSADSGLPDGVSEFVGGGMTHSVVADAGVTGGQFWRAVMGGTSTRNLITIDAVSSQADVEVLMRTRSDGNALAAPTIRIGGSAGNEDAYWGRVAEAVTDPNADFARIEEYVGGTFAVNAETSIFKATSATWYLKRVQIIGDTIRLRVWEDGSSEPGTWTIVHAPTSLNIASGLIGVRLFSSGTQYDIDWISWSTNPSSTSAPSL